MSSSKRRRRLQKRWWRRFNLSGPVCHAAETDGGGWAGTAAVVALVFAFTALAGPSQVDTQMVVQSDSLATGSVTLEERAWGTAITLELAELPPSDTYVAWAADRSGEWQQVATWGPTPNSSAHVSGASSFETADLERIVVTPADQSEHLFEARNDEE